MKGFTLVELLIVTLVLSILATIGTPVIKDVIETKRVNATVETMKALAAAADIARQLPGGDGFIDAPTSVIANLLNAYDENSLGLTSTPLLTHWGTSYLIDTTGQYATVRTSIPLRDINPFETVSTPAGSSTILLVSHQPQGVNRALAITSKYNKKHLYLEPNDEE
ncbi:MAG: prepilin-type N-terminal cleavage/methylation domain-containing protein [Methylophaga sp.]|jgi:prepilin-type N-terminal cleavage/methylation domain-containing protein|uniref:pilus assembly FimT family protein n=1 Tax=Methylophaga sp. TaxID=2024840 RepID=UPI00299D909E|nr:prepilin-type N-terminal cleavage/methylation domain-containing protein [Methylophaga sp.]MDX1750979.1 prepilin-type N-terminal cleavage/methylation domain-containing protein [Methylophaga sp.]